MERDWKFAHSFGKGSDYYGDVMLKISREWSEHHDGGLVIFGMIMMLQDLVRCCRFILMIYTEMEFASHCYLNTIGSRASNVVMQNSHQCTLRTSKTILP